MPVFIPNPLSVSVTALTYIRSAILDHSSEIPDLMRMSVKHLRMIFMFYTLRVFKLCSHRASSICELNPRKV